MNRILSLRRVFPILASCCAIPFLSGCAPTRITLYDLAPASPSVSWDRGIAMASCQDSGFAAEAGFVEADRLSARIRVRLRNLSAGRVDLDPQRFAFVVHMLDSAGTDHPLTLSMEDRDLRLREIADASARESAKANPYAYDGFDAASDFLGGVVAIAGLFARKTPEQRAQEEKERERDRDRREQRERDERDWNAEHSRVLSSLDAQRDFWQRQALSRTTLAPGGVEEGLLVAPLHPDASTVDLLLRLGSGQCTIPFRQRSRTL